MLPTREQIAAFIEGSNARRKAAVDAVCSDPAVREFLRAETAKHRARVTEPRLAKTAPPS